MDDRLTIRQGDCLEILRTLPDESVHCCVTSPPYWGLRDYGCAGQIGLEPTPQEFVAKLVAVFAEVRRVLRSDGTCWCNLGDSYAAERGGTCMPAETLAGGVGGKSDYDDPLRGRVRHKQTMGNRNASAIGLKHKDLCGIPWRVAFALQQPRYTGRIKDIQDRIWLAAMIDAEGCMFIHKRKAGQNNGQGYERQNDTYGPGLEVANTSEAIVQRCMSIVGSGSICSQSPDHNNRRKQTIYRWNLRLAECRDIIQEVYPHFTAKQHQARIMCACPTSGPDADKAHQSLIALHNGGTATIDFKEPASMFVPGWYLRSDIIWAKSNPMPESVTDRPTKAHEYIFLLTKSERYAYDAEAVKEAQADGRDYASENRPVGGKKHREENGPNSRNGSGQYDRDWDSGDFGYKGTGRNKRTVWTVPSAPYSEAHFATFPPDLIKPCILAGCPVGGTVLDPFFGSGTTGMVSLELGRKCIGIELNQKYIELSEDRCNVTPGLAF